MHAIDFHYLYLISWKMSTLEPYMFSFWPCDSQLWAIQCT